MSGPLAGLRVVELAGIGPVPHAGMVLADLGADVVLVARPAISDGSRPAGATLRKRRALTLDLKEPAGRDDVLRLTGAADVLMEGFAAGGDERLGIGPQECCARNPRLVYARMTGWGQDGPLSGDAGHDINYLAITGALGALGPTDPEPPSPPLNLVGDYGGGSMLLLVGILAALHERSRSGRGQVVDAAMVDGVSSLLQFVWDLRSEGRWGGGRGVNVLDGGAPFYAAYQCRDGRYLAVGAIEQFYARFVEGLGLAEAGLPPQGDRTQWPAMRERFAATIALRTRDEWTATFEGRDACATPVLSLDEVERPSAHRGAGYRPRGGRPGGGGRRATLLQDSARRVARRRRTL